MEKGQILEIKIDDMSGEGQGIGRADDGFVVFVPGAVVGDTARVQLTKVKKRYAFSKLMEIMEFSVARNEAFQCDSFDEGCGGCPYGKLRYDEQLRIKQRQVYDKLSRLGGIADPTVRSIIGMHPDDNEGMGCYRYRSKASFPVSTGGIITRKGGIVENLGEPAVGFFRPKSHDVVDCEDCWLQSMPAMAAADALRTFMEEDNITAWDPKWKKGLMRHLVVKTAFSTGEVMVILVINGKGIPNSAKLIEMLDDAVYETGYSLESVVTSIHKGNDNEIMGEENIIIAGKSVITDYIGDLQFEISPSSFYQVNPVQMKRLYDKVREYCGFSSKETDSISTGENPENSEVSPVQKKQDHRPVILDLYCGVGTIGLCCADNARAVIGIESVKEAVINANRNAVINNIVNARYLCGRAEELLPDCISGAENIDNDIAKFVQQADIAILDPPRAGCRPELLDAVAATSVDRIVYVSCDPATLARDIKHLNGHGFRFIEATPVDMFPNSSHTETVCLLSNTRKKKGSYVTLDVEMDDYYRIKGEGKSTK